MGPWGWWGTPQWVVGLVAVWLIFRFSGRGWSRGRDRKDAERHEVLAAEVDELRRRVAELEGESGRLAEVEDRLDFTERMLAKPAEVRRMEH
ncbi:MAG: hypothetical protein ACREL2_07195 [Gemmatimonadales bacterium]